MTNLRAHWQQMLQKNRDYYHRFLSTDPFAKWNSSKMPEVAVEQSLFRGVQILMLEPSNADGTAYLDRAIQIASKAQAEDTCKSPRCAALYPINLAKILRGQAIADFLVSSRSNCETFRQASQLFLEGARAIDGRARAAQIQAYRLAGIRCAILSGEYDKADSSLRRSEDFIFHTTEQAALVAFCQFQLTSRDGEVANQSLMHLLCQVRDPFFPQVTFIERDALAFDLAWMVSSFGVQSISQVPAAAIFAQLLD